MCINQRESDTNFLANHGFGHGCGRVGSSEQFPIFVTWTYVGLRSTFRLKTLSNKNCYFFQHLNVILFSHSRHWFDNDEYTINMMLPKTKSWH